MDLVQWMSLREVTELLAKETGADWKWKDVVRAVHDQNPRAVHIVNPTTLEIYGVASSKEFLKGLHLSGDELETAFAYCLSLSPEKIPATAIRIDWSIARELTHPEAFKALVGEVLTRPRKYLWLIEAMNESQLAIPGGGSKLSHQAGPMQPTAKRNKLRTNSLDAPIKKAIEQAKSVDTGAVWVHLRELAINEEKPFTGVVEGNALCYTADGNNEAKLSKDALRKRLKSHILPDGCGR